MELSNVQSTLLGFAEKGSELPTKSGEGLFLFAKMGRATAVARASFFLHRETRSRFLLTKRRVQGGEATSERRRRDGVSGKSFLSPTGRTGVALFTDKKRGKSHQRKAPRPPLQTTSHPVELAAESNARQVCAIYSKSKKLLSISPHIISHTARANKVRRKKRADSTG